jgi:hypothetical protein
MNFLGLNHLLDLLHPHPPPPYYLHILHNPHLYFTNLQIIPFINSLIIFIPPGPIYFSVRFKKNLTTSYNFENFIESISFKSPNFKSDYLGLSFKAFNYDNFKLFLFVNICYYLFIISL